MKLRKMISSAILGLVLLTALPASNQLPTFDDPVPICPPSNPNCKPPIQP